MPLVYPSNADATMIDIAIVMMNGGTRSQMIPKAEVNPTRPQTPSTAGSRYHAAGLPAPTQLVARIPPSVIVAGRDRSSPPDRITRPCPNDSTTRNDPSTRTVSICDHDPSDGLTNRAPNNRSKHSIATVTALMVSRLIRALVRVSPACRYRESVWPGCGDPVISILRSGSTDR